VVDGGDRPPASHSLLNGPTLRGDVSSDESLESLVVRSETIMKWLELGAAYFLVALFAIGVFDLGLSLYQLLVSGRFTDPNAVIDLIDTVLILLIIVEVYETVIAFSRNEPVTRIVITAALIAIARKVISFRTDEFASIDEAFTAAGAFSLLLGVLIAGFFVVRRLEYAGIEGSTGAAASLGGSSLGSGSGGDTGSGSGSGTGAGDDD
jgi:uncharacterized membrane protein (DUF373 family)